MSGPSSPRPYDRVRLNVGGVLFETSVSTLTKAGPSFLSTLIEERWRGDGELFIDRDATHFSKVLNYLRDGCEFVPPRDPDICEEIRREAQFYNLPGLAELCSNYEIKVGDLIQWRREAVDIYWKPFIRYMVDDSLSLPFVYEKNNHTLAKCIGCEEYQDPKGTYLISIDYDHWEPMRHHMTAMRGEVTQLMGDNCCIIIWDNGQSIHLPRSALRKAEKLY